MTSLRRTLLARFRVPWVLLGMALARPALGDEPDCSAMGGGSEALAAAGTMERLQFVRGVLTDQAARARLWTGAWILTGTALVLGNGVRAAIATTPDTRTDSLVSAVTSVSIPVALLVNPLRVIENQARLERMVADGAGPAPCVTLALAETLLEASAEDERRAAGLSAHAFVFGGNMAVGLFLALGYHHVRSGLVTALGGIALGELQIATQPTGAVGGLRDYRRGALRAPRTSWRVLPLVVGDVRGAVLELSF